ncbi:PREDICTED: glycosyltransferase 1 domain-containing protein 1-like isoform X1 [Branchiostoma belcheri]|uniref:Glycosyltransferase 1 domain-containing protein 1-like isoform X1 n=1 Tax=Branchiostoma belcheri TaxID=7741 RepID=A0A6P4XJI4_BRABE|nr:PREDICTED: glycosyltransferase 1 domain-containing protein 1-like isoform X1 [Branchiostoma belcheri]
MTTLFLAYCFPCSGNLVTAERIRTSLESGGHRCIRKCTSNFDGCKELWEFINNNDIRCIMGINACRTGNLLRDCPVPFGLVFGGTDLNESAAIPDSMDLMTATVNQARFLVCFSKEIRQQALRLWPHVLDKIHIQPQGVCTYASASSHLSDILTAYRAAEFGSCACGCTDNLNDSTKVFLLVCGLRPVKDPLYLLQVFSEWHRDNSRVLLIIVGPEMNEDYARKVKGEIRRCPGILLLPPLPQADLHTLMLHSCAVVNSSVSEGMSGAILEAMCLGVPVIARNIAGNAAIITHKETGLLFNSPEEFVSEAKCLLSDEDLYKTITAKAQDYVNMHHSGEVEKQTYCRLISSVLSQ